MVATFRQPFDMLAETVIETRNECVAEAASAPVSDKWLPFVSAYRTMCLAPDPDFRRVLQDARGLMLAA